MNKRKDKRRFHALATKTNKRNIPGYYTPRGGRRL